MFGLRPTTCLAALLLHLSAMSAVAQPPMGGGPPGGYRGPDPDEIIDRLDDNHNGQVDLDEMEGRSRFFLDMLARDNGLDLSKPIKTDKLRDMLKARFGGGSSSSGSSSSNVRTVSTAGVPGFGTTAVVTKVPGFGPGAVADSWDTLKQKYDGRVVNEIQDALRRYDRNNDGELDAAEIKNGQWRSDPREYDKNKDGKLSRSELAERYKARSSSGGYGGGPPGGYGGGPPGGYGGYGGYGGGGPPPQMASMSSSSPAPSSSSGGSSSSSSGSSNSGNSGGSTSSSRPSSSGSSGGSSTSTSTPSTPPASLDERILKFAEGMINQHDANKNGKLERSEWGGLSSDRQKADRDGDGVITKEELARQLADYGRGSSSSSATTPTSSGSSSGTSSSTRSSSSNSSTRTTSSSGGVRKTYRFLSAKERLPDGLPDWFASKDADGDGQVAMGEYASTWDDAKAREFAGLDRNGDGLITPKEAAGR